MLDCQVRDVTLGAILAAYIWLCLSRRHLLDRNLPAANTLKDLMRKVCKTFDTDRYISLPRNLQAPSPKISNAFLHPLLSSSFGYPNLSK